MNFYYLQKTKQFDGFLRGFQLLKKLGFNLHEAMDSYCELISKQSPRYLIDSCKHSPNKYIRKRCFDLLPHSIILALCRKFKKIYFLMHSTEFYNRFPSAWILWITKEIKFFTISLIFLSPVFIMYFLKHYSVNGPSIINSIACQYAESLRMNLVF